MGYNNKLKNLALILAAAGIVSSFSARAATSIATKNTEFTPDNATQTLQAKAQSWYNPTMGYTGWTHHSSWGYMKLKKGKPVTLTAEVNDAEIAGFHPALTVWSRPQKRGLASVDQMNSHSYNQYGDIYEANAINTDDQANPVKVGNIQMEFIANAFDRDGMGDMLPEKFDHSMLNRVVDGDAGKVSLTFTPKVSGVYQFVVGGINPDEGLSTTAFHPVAVTVSFPE
ncbi:copper(I)-binding protein CorA [Methylomicrobium sp. Wu6]|uniref:copper(I)-binding protein CorA n=1 Tax=Methylomicrobium sp. Wu6 TaxID=3107928 RepID=UPI002DD649A6|nr:copper(I)-binding protein CorA [Methylomicrobium sp. Wu6]MEC4748229.1 copper(I)-binding protein CorA [Methylomicrobium sp. Wu6]